MTSATSVFAIDNFQHSCRSCPTNGHCLGQAALNGDHLKAFESTRGPIRVLRAGQALYRAGEAFDALFIVRSGMVKVSSVGPDGTEQVIGFLLPGDPLGLDGIESGRHATTAVALETSSICPLPYERLNRLCSSVGELQLQLLRLVSRELTARQNLLLTIGQKNAEARLATFLLSMSARLRALGFSGKEFRLSMSRQDIAHYLGLTLETVCRILTRFQDAGLITRDRRFVRLLDATGLLARISMTAEAREAVQLVA